MLHTFYIIVAKGWERGKRGCIFQVAKLLELELDILGKVMERFGDDPVREGFTV